MPPCIREGQFMDEFDVTSSSYHRKNNITLGDEGEHTLYVWCTDTFWRPEPYKYTFELKVDTSAPVITSLYTTPASPIAERPINATMSVVADEKVICRYSSVAEQYEDMGNEFSDNDEYKTRKNTHIYFPTNIEDTFYVACKNQAGLISETKDITIKVDSTIPLSITDHTEPYQGSAMPKLAVETNKKASCRYSFVDPDVKTGTLLGSTDSYAHTATLQVNVSSSEHTVYVRCFRSGEDEKATVMFFVDITPPAMEYVDDTSKLAAYPELTPPIRSRR